MKRYIGAASYESKSILDDTRIAQLAQDAGYMLEVAKNGELKIIATWDSIISPEIYTTRVDEFDGQGYYYNVDVKYPEYHSREADYADDMEYQVKQFMEAAKFVTALSKWHS